MRNPFYLTQRGRTFYYNRRLPQRYHSSGTKRICVSLRASSRREAKYRLKLIDTQIKRLITLGNLHMLNDKELSLLLETIKHKALKESWDFKESTGKSLMGTDDILTVRRNRVEPCCCFPIS